MPKALATLHGPKTYTLGVGGITLRNGVSTPLHGADAIAAARAVGFINVEDIPDATPKKPAAPTTRAAPPPPADDEDGQPETSAEMPDDDDDGAGGDDEPAPSKPTPAPKKPARR